MLMQPPNSGANGEKLSSFRVFKRVKPNNAAPWRSRGRRLASGTRGTVGPHVSQTGGVGDVSAASRDGGKTGKHMGMGSRPVISAEVRILERAAFACD